MNMVFRSMVIPKTSLGKGLVIFINGVNKYHNFWKIGDFPSSSFPCLSNLAIIIFSVLRCYLQVEYRPLDLHFWTITWPRQSNSCWSSRRCRWQVRAPVKMLTVSRSFQDLHRSFTRLRV